MPHLRIRGVDDKIVQKFSDGLNEELAPLVSTSPDNFTVESIESRFFDRGNASGAYPFIEVLWFERDQETKKNVARYLTAKMRNLVGAVDIAVVFSPIAKADYFENGSHF